MRRSANVDFPWSMWATMQKFRIRDGGVTGSAADERSGQSQPLKLVEGPRGSNVWP
jgi:hypothetical protein